MHFKLHFNISTMQDFWYIICMYNITGRPCPTSTLQNVLLGMLSRYTLYSCCIISPLTVFHFCSSLQVGGTTAIGVHVGATSVLQHHHCMRIDFLLQTSVPDCLVYYICEKYAWKCTRAQRRCIQCSFTYTTKCVILNKHAQQTYKRCDCQQCREKGDRQHPNRR